MMGPTLLQPPGVGSNPALVERIATAEEDITALKSGKATTGSVTAVSNRVKTLEDAPAGGGVHRRVLLGIHPITSGSTFNRAALLAESFMSGVPTSACDVDLYLVGGGASGEAYGIASNATVAQRSGGRAGEVRVVRGLRLDDIVNGTALLVGAGGAGLSNGSRAGGTTTFGRWSARGGGATTITMDEYDDLSDLRIGRPGFASATTPLLTAQSSLGPGSGGAAATSNSGPGGASGVGDSDTQRAGGARRMPGASASAASFAYGSGGGGSAYSVTGHPTIPHGGFPSGGGGSIYDTAYSANNGSGGAGVIRLAVYRWVSV